MNIHLVNDEKFIDKSIERFENYYPNSNIVFVITRDGVENKYLYINDSCVDIISLKINDTKAIDVIKSYCKDGDNVFVHYLTNHKAIIVNELKKCFKIQSYWILYGIGLYSLINTLGLYQLIDCNKFSNEWFNRCYGFLHLKKKYFINKFNELRGLSCNSESIYFIEQLEYFCFWNQFDYQLLRKYFKTNAKWRYFLYFDAIMPGLKIGIPEKKVKNSVILNHQSSRTGNHLTILKKISKIDKNKEIIDLYIPLSYGNESVKKSILCYSESNLGYCFKPIFKFMVISEYFLFLSKIEVAIFGHRRQEAAANIFFLLSSGAKVFLRKQNNLLRFFRELGIEIYEIEEDLDPFINFKALDKKNQIKNRELILKIFSQDRIDETYKSLIKK